MAKFYQRYLPPPTSTVIQYGYRGANLTVNGANYTAATNLEQVGNYQLNPACNDYGTCVASLAVSCVFEPSFFANQFDLTGGRFSGEYQAGIYQSYGTTIDPCNNFYTFKNHTCLCATTFCVNTSSAVSCTQGCVLPGSAAVNTCPVAADTCCGVYSGTGYCFRTPSYSAGGNYYIVESPSGTFNCIVPFTQYGVGLGLCCACICAPAVCAFEPTFGDTCPVGFYNSCANVSYYRAGGNGVCCWCILPYGPAVYGLGQACTGVCQSDGMMFGASCAMNLGFCYICTSISASCSNFTVSAFNSGAYLNSTCAAGTPELGVRTFLTTKSPYQFYMLHNSTNGGIQGVDVSTSTAVLVRLSLRVFNLGGGTTTVLLNHKKGLPGLVIPSQSDIETTTAYRYYMINFNGADAWGTTTASQTISIFRTELNLSTGAITANVNYALTMSTSTQAAIYANAGVNGTYTGQYNNPQVRRQTVNRIWYSVDGNGVRRLHMGVYNTNGSGQITSGNGFNNGLTQGAMFQIYSWSLNDGAFTAAYIGAVNTAQYAPRYFCPLDSNWNTIYAGSSFGNDNTFTLNQTTGLYQYAATMNYIGSRLFQDYSGRWAVQVVDTSISANSLYSNYIDFLSNTVGNTLVISASTTTFVYTGTTISGNILVNVYNYQGTRTSSTVALSIIGATTTPGMQFAGATYNTTVVCSTSTDTSVAISIVSAQSSKVVGTITSN
jgi:hypothetical protein